MADRHYNRQKIGASQFVPPGRCMVLLTDDASALWVTSWPFAEYTHHHWAGAWMNSCFRNEGGDLSSALIAEAVCATRWWFDGPLPDQGMVTFVDAEKTRKKGHPGYCYRVLGFEHVGFTGSGLHALQLSPARLVYFPPASPRGAQQELFGLAII